MTEIQYKQFPAYLETMEKDGGEGELAPVFLIYGEEYLCKTAFNALLNVLVPAASRSFNYEPVDGLNDGAADAVQRVNTYSFMPGRKVVAILDSQIFHSRRDMEKILEKARKSYEDDNLKRGAGHLLNLLALMNLSFEDIGKSGKNLVPAQSGQQATDDKWLETLIQYCRDRHLSIPKRGDSSRILQEAIEKGFPQGNHLIITTDIVDKRRSLFKLLLEKGVVVNCSVPKGGRKADKAAQESVLVETMESVLGKAGKTANREVYRAVANMTGFDLRTFINNLEKLVSYSGDRKTITLSDVETVLKRSKRDPVYVFTNAVTDRSFDRTFFYMDSLLADPDIGHPLQLLSAVINQMRKLLVIKGFLEGQPSNGWYAGCSFNHFQTRVMPAVLSHDNLLLDHIDQWETVLARNGGKEDGGNGKKTRKGKKKRVMTDLVIAKNPKNAYPIYQMFRKSEHFTREELVATIEKLSEADHRMKTTGQDPRQVLEQVLFSICRPQP